MIEVIVMPFVYVAVGFLTAFAFYLVHLLKAADFLTKREIFIYGSAAIILWPIILFGLILYLMVNAAYFLADKVWMRYL
jgi:hypothetical protein